MVDVNCVHITYYDMYSGQEAVISLNGVDIGVKKAGDGYTLSHAGFEKALYGRPPKNGETLTDGKYDVAVLEGQYDVTEPPFGESW